MLNNTTTKCSSCGYAGQVNPKTGRCMNPFACQERAAGTHVKASAFKADYSFLPASYLESQDSESADAPETPDSD